MNCNLVIDGNPYSFTVNGNFENGSGDVLYNNSHLSSRSDVFGDRGYRVEPILNDNEFDKLRNSIQNKFNEILNELKITKDANINLEDYHKYVDTNDLQNKVTSFTKNFQNEDFNFDLGQISDRLGHLLNLKLDSYNPELGKTHVQLRISRPDSLDINPPHRDAYLSYYENVINLWVPIAGCSSLSNLPVAPGSHLYREEDVLKTESKGAEINGNTYMVPCILCHKNQSIEMIRPKLDYCDSLIFTPYLIHGSAVNLGSETRMSLELRLTIH